MTKKERFQAVRERRAPDCMPVYTKVKSQMVYGYDLMLPDITGQDWYDSDRITEAVLANIKNCDFDVAIPYYQDPGLGVPPLGGKFNIPARFGLAVSNLPDMPVKTKADWPKVKKLLARFDVRKTDPRMKGALEVIRNVSQDLGDEVPLVPFHSVGVQAAMFLLRQDELVLQDMYEDPDWVDEMCRLATDFAIDWIRAQYEAGTNSATFVAEGMGTSMASPEMNERFNLENIARLSEVVRKEFNQGTWIHLHGDFSKPKAYNFLTKLVTQAGIEGFHLDELNSPDWVKANVIDKLGVSACVVVDGGIILNGPESQIKESVKSEMSKIGDGLGFMMAPSCQLLPATSNENFRAWVDATHVYGKYPLKVQRK